MEISCIQARYLQGLLEVAIRRVLYDRFEHEGARLLRLLAAESDSAPIAPVVPAEGPSPGRSLDVRV